MACDTHAPLFWESEPPPTFAHMPLPKSSKARLNPNIFVISKLRVGLTIPMYPKCSWCPVRIETELVGRIGARVIRLSGAGRADRSSRTDVTYKFAGSPASEQSAHHAADQATWTAAPAAVMVSTIPAATLGVAAAGVGARR
jgi:hypothetical protein